VRNTWFHPEHVPTTAEQLPTAKWAPPARHPEGDSNESNATTESEEDREARIRRENLARALAAAKESLASQGLLGEFESSC
jgi:hypothetical protein